MAGHRALGTCRYELRRGGRAQLLATTTAAAIGCWCASPGDAIAQDAAVVALPEVVVITPSPVAKPKKKAAQPQPSPAPAPSTAAVPSGTGGAAEVEASDDNVSVPEQPAATIPGTLIVVDDSFATVTVVTPRDILATEGQTITDSLQTKPGISGSTFAPGANRPIIRGLDNFRVRVQENGLGSGDVSAVSEDHAVTIDPFSAGQTEVVRGPATLRYGSQAIGGVVAVENQRIPTFIPNGGVSAEIKGGLTSVDEGRDGAISATAGAMGFAVHADAFKRQSEDYETPKGIEPNTFVDSEGFAVGTSLIGPSGFLGVAFTRFESLYGIPGEEALELRPRIDLEQEKVLVKGEWRVKDSGVEALRIWFGASDYAHDEVIAAEGIIGTRFTNEQYEARAELQHQTFQTRLGELSGAIGVQWGDQDIKGVAVDEPVDALLDPANVTTIAGFWFEELKATNALRFQAAARIEQTEASGNGYTDISDPSNPVEFAGTRGFTPISGSLGALYDLPMGVVARLNGQYAERAPAATELYSKGVHEATGTFEIGNPDLGIETAQTVELGFRRASGSFRYDATAYYTKFDGYIYKQLTGLDCADTLVSCGGPFAPDDETLSQVIYQQRDATFYGVEIASQYDVAAIWNGVWGVDAQYDFVNAEFSNGDNVPRIPPHRLGGGLYYRDQAWYARAGVLHAFEQDRVAPSEPTTPSYTLVSAELSYTTLLTDLAGPPQQFTIGLRGDNLANDEVLNSASFKRLEGVLQPGASVRLFGSIKLN